MNQFMTASASAARLQVRFGRDLLILAIRVNVSAFLPNIARARVQTSQWSTKMQFPAVLMRARYSSRPILLLNLTVMARSSN
jgi:hypothetical protein